MKTKKYLLVCTILLLSLIGTACTSSTPPPVSSVAPSESPDSQSATLSENETTKATYTIKIGHVEAEDRSTHKALLEYQKYVEEQSKGDLKVEIYSNGLLGADTELTQGVQLGTIQMTLPATSALVSFSPKFGVLDMPFLFDTPENGFAALDGELGAELDKVLDQNGLLNLGYAYNGQRSMTNSVKPINEPDDLKGLKVRVMESPVYISLFQALGANPTPMGFGEVFTGLQQKTVDAQENAPSLIYAMKFYEAQRYLSLTGHTKSFMPVLINKAYFEKLPEQYQTIVREGARTFAIEKQRQMEIESEAESIDLLKQAGMEVNEVTPENLEKFKEKVKPVYEQFEQELGKDLFELAAKYAK